MVFLNLSSFDKNMLQIITNAQISNPKPNARLRWMSARGGVMNSSIIVPNLKKLTLIPYENQNSWPMNQLLRNTNLQTSNVSLPIPNKSRPIIANMKAVVKWFIKKLETMVINCPIVSNIANEMKHSLRPMVSINHPPKNGSIILPYHGTAYSWSNLGLFEWPSSPVILSFISSCAFFMISNQ